ncbi:MAG: hypothetical protein WD059_14650 [Balneolaceae bacterium]
MPEQEKSITLTPSWKAFFWSYFFGILLIPLLLGIILLWNIIKKHKSISYLITDRTITVVEEGYSQNIDIANITQAKTGSVQFGVGSVILQTNSREVELIGLENPDQLRKFIEIAVDAELKRLETEKQVKSVEPKYKPGNMDRLNYLTGLWQQGLLSDEDFDEERKNFEPS